MGKVLIIKSIGIVPMYQLISSYPHSDIHILGHERNLGMLADIKNNLELYIYPHNTPFDKLDVVKTIDGNPSRLNLKNYEYIIIPTTQNDPKSIKNIYEMLINYEPDCKDIIYYYDTTKQEYTKLEPTDIDEPLWLDFVGILGMLVIIPFLKLKQKLDSMY